MLYRTARFSAFELLRAAATRIAGVIALGRRSAVDAKCFDGLNEHQLRDLGVRRYEDHHFHETFYR